MCPRITGDGRVGAFQVLRDTFRDHPEAVQPFIQFVPTHSPASFFVCVCVRAYVCVRVCMCACVILALNLFADGSAQRLPSHWAPPFLSFPLNSLSVAFLFLVLGVLIQLVAFAVGRFFFFVF